jgi:hypothetical protein
VFGLYNAGSRLMWMSDGMPFVRIDGSRGCLFQLKRTIDTETSGAPRVKER